MYTITFAISTLLISLCSGALGAMLGLGGGVFLVPLLVFLFKVPIHLAAGASIIAVLATSSGATVNYVKNDITNLRLGIFLELATTIGAITGAFLTTIVNESIIQVVFGLVLFYAAIAMHSQIRKLDRSWVAKPNDKLAEMFHLNGSYYDVARGQNIEYGVSNTPITLGISYVAGVVSGLLGIGGGGIKVPVMNALSNIPIKAAIATSSFMIGVTAAVSSLVYMNNGFCDVFLTAPVVLGSLIGSFIGAKMTYRVKGVTLKKVFTVVLAILAALMIVSGMGI
jgi:uncharacterized membrane protein YfcA